MRWGCWQVLSSHATPRQSCFGRLREGRFGGKDLSVTAGDLGPLPSTCPPSDTRTSACMLHRLYAWPFPREGGLVGVTHTPSRVPAAAVTLLHLQVNSRLIIQLNR
jgi:hypothetical protein